MKFTKTECEEIMGSILFLVLLAASLFLSAFL
jgi:hypothetical protein